MAAALQLTPKTLGYKLSDDTKLPRPEVIDRFIARLMVEDPTDDDKIRTPFIGVFNMAMLYGIETADANTPASELKKTEGHLKRYLESLQRAIQERLK
jgi:hypothetical protein